MDREGLARAAVVVIGRNEGERLSRCLEALPRGLGAAIYVDSGSTDGSIALAHSHGLDAVVLERGPFSAARARNEGFARVRERHPTADFVQFVDGDCVLAEDWLARAAALLEERPDVVAVHGRVHEMHPERSPYNRLCEIEWSTPEPGESAAFGGIFAVRGDAFDAVGGFDAAVIAAEDDELSLRLRRSGGRIWRLPDAMAHHDAAMTRFGQWWRRSLRLGHAYAQVSDLHRSSPEGYFRGEARRAWLWGGVLPLVAVVGGALFGWAGLAPLLLYPAQLVRVAAQALRRGLVLSDALLWSAACGVSRFAELMGMLRYHFNKQLGRPMKIIEYKDPEAR